MRMEKVKFTVGRKLWFGFMSVVIIMIIIGGVGFLSLKSVAKSSGNTFIVSPHLLKCTKKRL